MKKLLVLILWFFVTELSLSQQPTLKLDSVKSISGDSVIVNLLAENLSNIGALTIKISFDTTALSWGRTLNWDAQFEGALAGIVNNQITLAWDGLSGVNLSNGKLVELKLLYKGNTSSLVFDTVNTELANLEGEIVKTIFINGSVSPLTDLREKLDHNIPKDYLLSQNFPNPFNPTTTITFGLLTESEVTITLYNMLGEVVLKNELGIKASGYHESIVDLSSKTSGVYFYEIQANALDGSKSFREVKKMMLLK